MPHITHSALYSYPCGGWMGKIDEKVVRSRKRPFQATEGFTNALHATPQGPGPTQHAAETGFTPGVRICGKKDKRRGLGPTIFARIHLLCSI